MLAAYLFSCHSGVTADMHLVVSEKIRAVLYRAFGSLFILTFGLATLGFLVAIEHQNWFDLRPATGSARALSLASDRAIGSEQAQARPSGD